MAAKHWIPEALRGLTESLVPVPHEINEIDWIARLSDNSARLVEHLMAFANRPGGGTLVFRVDARGAESGAEAHENLQPFVIAVGQNHLERRVTVGFAMGFDGSKKQWKRTGLTKAEVRSSQKKCLISMA